MGTYNNWRIGLYHPGPFNEQLEKLEGLLQELAQRFRRDLAAQETVFVLDVDVPDPDDGHWPIFDEAGEAENERIDVMLPIGRALAAHFAPFIVALSVEDFNADEHGTYYFAHDGRGIVTQWQARVQPPPDPTAGWNETWNGEWLRWAKGTEPIPEGVPTPDDLLRDLDEANEAGGGDAG